MSEIKLNCPDCGKEIKIRIKTIESLREEVRILKIKVASLKMMKNKTRTKDDDINDDFPNWFMNNIFKGEE